MGLLSAIANISLEKVVNGVVSGAKAVYTGSPKSLGQALNEKVFQPIESAVSPDPTKSLNKMAKSMGIEPEELANATKVLVTLMSAQASKEQKQ